MGRGYQSEVLKAPAVPPTADAFVYILPYSIAGAEGLLVVNKKATPIQLTLAGVKQASAKSVEVYGPEPALNPPITRLVHEDGTLYLGPFAVAIVSNIVR